MWCATRFYAWTATFYPCYERHWKCIADDTSVLLNGKRYTDLVALLNSKLEKSLFGSNPISYFSIFRKHITWYFTEQESNQMSMPLSEMIRRALFLYFMNTFSF